VPVDTDKKPGWDEAGWDRLVKALQPHVDAAMATGEPSFKGKPDRWWDGGTGTGTWRCCNDHVSTFLLKTEQGYRCIACGEPVLLTFPEDKDGPLHPLEDT
jgi:hypothetical protein